MNDYKRWIFGVTFAIIIVGYETNREFKFFNPYTGYVKDEIQKAFGTTSGHKIKLLREGKKEDMEYGVVFVKDLEASGTEKKYLLFVIIKGKDGLWAFRGPIDQEPDDKELDKILIRDNLK